MPAKVLKDKKVSKTRIHQKSVLRMKGLKISECQEILHFMKKVIDKSLSLWLYLVHSL